ncbi:unnamed protein product [Urochloa decumbens]|uniref:C2H2-type domain-containing protein n=1 Tax=Urochloa decumbens TaxID=240449 RepID=A0ABC9C0Z3_9POAL
MHGLKTSMAHNEQGAVAAAAATRRQLTSTVWGSFRINRPAAGTGGGPVTATCGECGQTLRACSSIGTSHLRRHTATKRCQKLAAELRRRRQQLVSEPCSAAEAPPPPGDHEAENSMSPAPVDVEEEFFVVDDIDIAGLFDYLNDEDLVNIDEQISEADEHLGTSNYVPVVPQAPSSSTRWFRKKKKERTGAESKKRCAPEDESGLDHLSAHAQAEFSCREKRMLSNSSAAIATVVQDHSHASSKSRAALYKIG